MIDNAKSRRCGRRVSSPAIDIGTRRNVWRSGSLCGNVLEAVRVPVSFTPLRGNLARFSLSIGMSSEAGSDAFLMSWL